MTQIIRGSDNPGRSDSCDFAQEIVLNFDFFYNDFIFE